MSKTDQIRRYLTRSWDRALDYFQRNGEDPDLDPPTDVIELPHDKKKKRIDRDSLRFQQKEIRRQRDIAYWKDVISKLGDRPADDYELKKAKNELRTLEQRTRKSAIKGIQGKETKSPRSSSDEAKAQRGRKPRDDRYRKVVQHISFDPTNGVEIA